MNAILAFIPKQVLAGVVIALLILAGYQTGTIKKQAGEVAKAIVAVAQAKQVNTENVATIEQVSEQLKDSVEGRRADEARQVATAHKWEVERETLKALANEIRVETMEVYRDPTCSDLAKLNITNVCPAFVSGMRQRADRINQSRNTGSPGPSTDAATD